jgi:imidazolonepropionase
MAVSYVVSKLSDNDWDQVWAGANLATMAGNAAYGSILDAAIAIKGERIAWIGAAAEGRRLARVQGLFVHEAQGQWITPGLIDCHTHLVYGGDRIAEFEQRLCGATYEEIARAGGGILSTMRETRAASQQSLYESARRRMERMIADGVTTVEIKSGYGLELDAERRLLEVARSLGETLPVSVKTTFLGLHSLPPEFAGQRRRYVDEVSGDWLSALVSAGLVDAVDSFCENIAFSVAETEQFLLAAKNLGVPAHVHAGQLSDMGAAESAAKLSALSADHLEFLSERGARAMAERGTVAVLLPAAYFTLRQDTPPPIALLRSEGVPMAVATDCNPGTSPCTSILLAMSMGCTLFGLTPEEALAGATRNGARALGTLNDVGTLEVGKRADLAFWRIGRPAELCYGLGGNPCTAVMHRGKLRGN